YSSSLHYVSTFSSPISPATTSTSSSPSVSILSTSPSSSPSSNPSSAATALALSNTSRPFNLPSSLFSFSLFRPRTFSTSFPFFFCSAFHVSNLAFHSINNSNVTGVLRNPRICASTSSFNRCFSLSSAILLL